jgi:hypothetical protein
MVDVRMDSNIITLLEHCEPDKIGFYGKALNLYTHCGRQVGIIVGGSKTCHTSEEHQNINLFIGFI